MTTDGPHRRSRVLIALLVLVNLPVTLAAIQAVSFYVLHRNNGAIVSAGRDREYLLYVPPSYDASKPAPLVISMHGAAIWPAAHREMTRWDAVADQHGFIVVYPSGMGRRLRTWNLGAGYDSQFIADLIDRLKAEYNIDSNRIYADGLSNGGGMAFALSCTLSDRIAAVGMVGAALLEPFEWCTDTTAVPMIAFHGTDDNATLYHGGSSWVTRRPFPGVPGFVASWARRNGCDPNADRVRVAANVERETYRNCVAGATVAFYTIHGGGHTWPGGGTMPGWAGTINREINASELMWDFFRRHQLQSSRSER